MDSRKYQLFKTELCRNWQEMGYCRYAKKCRFAHGQEELRCVQRHAKYKTEICKTFHLTGTCLYGVRCTFIHDEHVSPTNSSSSSPLFKPALASPTVPNVISTSSPTNPISTLNLAFSVEDNFNMWKNLTKADYSSNSIWSSSFDRRYSSSSSLSSSSSSSILSNNNNNLPSFLI